MELPNQRPLKCFHATAHTCVCRAPYAIDVGLDMGAYIIYQRTAPSSAAEKTRDSEAEGLSRQLQQTDRN